ncbi:MAG: metallophosphoesterase [Hormoscilla sp.]
MGLLASKNRNTEKIYFAGVGDVHGHFYSMLHLLNSWETDHCQSLTFVLQVGDFEPHRHLADMMTMDAPSKYKKVGEFPHFWKGNARFTHPIWFIGGNHEPYGFLDLTPDGAEIVNNCHYIGRVGCVELAGFKVVGVSGIYQEELFGKPRPSVREIDNRANSDYIGFLATDIDRALDYGKADILLLHEWPAGAIAPEDREKFDPTWGKVGNEYARILVEELQPKLVLCGHAHKRYIRPFFGSKEKPSYLCCLGKITQGKDAIAVFQATPDGEIIEVI